MPQMYWDTTDLGDAVTPMSKPAVTRVTIAKFAGAAQDYSPLHIDDDFAKGAGYGSVFAHGAISLGFAVEAVTRWCENGRVLSSTATFQKLVWPGDILTAKGVVVNRYEKNGEPRIDVDVWAENQNHDIVMKGQLTVILWRSDKDEKKSKTPWPPVSPETIKERRTGKPIPRTEAEQQKAREALAQSQAAHGAHSADRRGKSTPPPRPAAPPPAPAPRAAPVVAKPVPVAAKAPAAPAKAPAAPVKPAAAPAKAPPPPTTKLPAKAAPAPAKAPTPPAKKAAPAPAPAKKAAPAPAPAKKPAPAPAKKPAPAPAKKPAPAPAKKPAPAPAKKPAPAPAKKPAPAPAKKPAPAPAKKPAPPAKGKKK